MKKKIAAAIVVILALICLVSMIAHKNDNGINLLVIAVRDGGKLETLQCDVKPFIKQNRTMMPVESIAEALGLELIENKADKTITVSNGENTIKFRTDGPKIEVNGSEERLLVAPEMKSGSLLVPLRFVCDRFGYSIAWEDNDEEDTSYVWVSEKVLLSKEDVSHGRRADYFEDDGKLILNENGKTHRGTKLGDSYEDVVEKYGEPHDVSEDGNVIKYYGRNLPGVRDIYMEFTFEKGKLKNVVAQNKILTVNQQ